MGRLLGRIWPAAACSGSLSVGSRNANPWPVRAASSESGRSRRPDAPQGFAACLASSPTVIVVNGSSPYRTLGDLVDAARQRSGDLTMASIPTFRIAFEMLKSAANVNMTFVPYPGNAPAVTALLGNHVTSVFAVYPTVAEQVKAGKLRALATTSATRLELLPDVPTAIESGYKDYTEEAWFGVMTPAKTPKETVSQLTTWFLAALHAAESKPKLAVQGLYPVGTCGADFATYLRKQFEQYGRVIREANIKP
jgi:tripartite-type tricarboxylate transporter receptor subunit TctC